MRQSFSVTKIYQGTEKEHQKSLNSSWMQPLTFQRVEQKRTLRPKSTAITLTADLVTIFNFFFVVFSSQNSLALFHNFGNYSIFLVKSKLSTAKKSKTTTFSRVFHQKNRQFSREIKVEFMDKK